MDGYELQRLLQNRPVGWGAVGVCYPSVINGVQVAVKVCEWIRDEDGVEEMDNEVHIYKVLRPLQGKVVPHFYCCQTCGPVKVLIMSLIKGGKMWRPALDPRRIYEKKVVPALKTISELNVVHNDMRCENIMIQNSPPRVWIIDFGRAEVDDREEAKREMICEALDEIKTAWEFHEVLKQRKEEKRGR